jgi:succinate dehydrogenase / fumarate reductase cytochrome b subunit
MVSNTASTDVANEAGSAKVCAHNPLQLHQPEPGCKCGKLRPPRKLHASVGLWLTLFMILHLAIATTGINPTRYQSAAALLHRSRTSGAVLLLILLPLLLQAGSGLYLIAKEGMNYSTKRCDRGGKLRYFLQRWSGLAIMAYLFIHVGIMRGWLPLPHRDASVGSADAAAFSLTARTFQPWNSPAANVITIALVLVGILGTIYHAANGAWSGAILWKLVTTEEGKVRFEFLCAAFGIALAVMGVVAWYAFTLSPNVQAAFAGR